MRNFASVWVSDGLGVRRVIISCNESRVVLVKAAVLPLRVYLSCSERIVADLAVPMSSSVGSPTAVPCALMTLHLSGAACRAQYM